MALGAAGVVLAVWLLRSRLSARGFDWQVLGATFSSLRWGWLAAASAAAIASYLVRALRWSVLMRPVRPHPDLWQLCSATFIGFTAITLLGRPGELARPYLIATRQKVPVSSQLAAWLLERIFDLLSALAIFGFALSRVRRSDVSVGPALSWVLATGGWVVAALSVLTLGLLVAFRHFSGMARQRLLDALTVLPKHHFERAERLITSFVQGVESTKSDRALLLVIGYSIVEWAVIAICTYCVIQAFGASVHLGWLDVLIFLGFAAFGAVVQIPGIGGGVQVVSVVVLTELFKVPLEISTSVAFVSWIISFVVVVPIGLLLAVAEGVRWSALKPAEPETAG